MYPLPRSLSSLSLSAILLGVLSNSASAANPFPTFDTTRYPIGTSSTRLAIADFNQDGWHDVASLDGKDVVVRLGIGEGKLGNPQRTTLSGFTNFIQAGDFNGDGKSDLIVTHSVEKKISIMLGNGDGTFSVTTRTTPGSPQVLSVGDYDKDKKADFVVEIDDPAGSAIYFYRGNNDGTFSPSAGIPSGSNGVELLTADLNRDSKSDLVQVFGHSIFVYLGNGDGTFTFHAQLPAGTGRNYLGAVLADLNKDGVPDLALSGGALEIWMDDGAGNFTQFPNRNPRAGVFSNPVAADFDGDGALDLAYLDFSTTFKLAIVRGNGFGAYFPAVFSEDYGNAGSATLALRDMDKDGLHDIVGLTPMNGLAVSLNRSTTAACGTPDSYPLQVKICRVANGQNVWSPYVVEGVGNGPTRVVRMEVWLDGKKVDQAIGDRILHTINSAVGSHHVAIAAYDEFGNKGSSDITFRVVNTPCVASGGDRTVTICAAAPDATIFNPLRIQAAVQDSRPVAAMQVYVAATKVYEARNVRSIDFSMGTGLGPFRITVKAWDSLGGFSKSYILNIQSGCPTTGPFRTVTICSPVEEQNLSFGGFGGSSFIPVFASANGPAHTMQAYVDGRLRSSVAGKEIELFIGVTTSGRHRLTIKAWDKTGSFSKTIFVVAP